MGKWGWWEFPPRQLTRTPLLSLRTVFFCCPRRTPPRKARMRGARDPSWLHLARVWRVRERKGQEGAKNSSTYFGEKADQWYFPANNSHTHIGMPWKQEHLHQNPNRAMRTLHVVLTGRRHSEIPWSRSRKISNFLPDIKRGTCDAGPQRC